MAKLPNALGIDKTEYCKSLLLGMTTTSELVAVNLTDMALAFYHCEVPLPEATRYMQTYINKIVNNGVDIKCEVAS